MFAHRHMRHAKTLERLLQQIWQGLCPAWDFSTRETLSILMSDEQFDLVMVGLREVKAGEVLRLEDAFADVE
ncbi:MAG: hypothetical protein HEQ32_07960 [Vampirovibrio sp.]